MSVDVSVVLPVFNGEKHLERAVERLMSQHTSRATGADATFEIVIVDDGSTDSSVEIATRLEQRFAEVQAFSMPENSGVAAAREFAAAKCTGEFVWFIDDDDDWPDDAIATLLNAATATGADVVVAGARYVYSTGAPDRAVGDAKLSGSVSADAAFRLFLGGRISGHLWNKLFRRELLSGIEFTRAQVHSDQAMVAQLIAAAARVSFVDTVVYRYLVRSGSIVRSGRKRSGSLLTVGGVVARAARGMHPSLFETDDFAYYYQRFIVASALKDATSGAYTPTEEKLLFSQVRREVTVRGLISVAKRRDFKRLALLTSALGGRRVFHLVSQRARSVT